MVYFPVGSRGFSLHDCVYTGFGGFPASSALGAIVFIYRQSGHRAERLPPIAVEIMYAQNCAFTHPACFLGICK